MSEKSRLNLTQKQSLNSKIKTENLLRKSDFKFNSAWQKTGKALLKIFGYKKILTHINDQSYLT